MSGDRDRQNRRDSKNDATPARPSSARAGKDNRAARTRSRSTRRNGNDAGREANQRRGVGSLGLELEGHGHNRNGVGSLGLELEGQGRDGVGTLNLPLEGSPRGVGSLGLDLEGRDAPRRSGVGSLDLELEGDNKGRGRGKGDEAEELAGATSAPTTEAPQPTPEVSAQPDGEGQLAGTIPLITGPGLNKSKGDLDDLGRIADASQSATGTSTGASGRGGVPVVLDLDVSFDNSPGTGSAATQKQDPGQGNFNLSFSQPGGRAVSPFGSEFYEPEFANVAWKLEGGVCKITANLKINCPWGTADGGKIDVPSGTDSVVTKDNWQQIRDDLKPSGTSPHKSPRTQYYSKSLVERHEKFHGTDDWGWSQSSGVALVNAKCAATNINAGSAGAEVTSLMQTCRQLLISENFKWYKGGGSSHDTYAGEIRAYGDGKPHYAALATAVENHGRTL